MSTSSNPSYYQIFVRGFEGKTILLGTTMQLNKDTTISKLKELISDRTGIKSKETILIYGTKQLSENMDKLKLKDIGI